MTFYKSVTTLGEAIEAVTIILALISGFLILQIADLKRQLSQGGSQIASSRSPQPIEEPVEDQTTYSRRLVLHGLVGTSPLCMFSYGVH